MDYPTERPPRSRFVTQLGSISIMIALILIFQDLSTLSSLNPLNKSPMGNIVEQMMPSMSVSPSSIYSEIFLYLLGIAASIAMLHRLNWGRVMYMIILSASSLWDIVSSISSYMSLSHYLNMVGMGDSFSMVIVGNVLVAGINGVIVWKLSSKTVKAEFG